MTHSKRRHQDDAIECWLREEVVPVAIAMRDDPDRGIPAKQVFDMIRSLHAERMKGINPPPSPR